LRVKNTDSDYGIITILFHWSIALLIIGLIVSGLTMTSLPNNLGKLTLFGLHKQFGLLVLLIVILRLFWRLFNKIPALPRTMPKWQVISAHISHYLLYILMFTLPITGWLLTSAAGFPVSFFKLFIWPVVGRPNEKLEQIYTQTHDWLGIALTFVVVVHIGAALMHHFIDRDNVLRRMLPWN